MWLLGSLRVGRCEVIAGAKGEPRVDPTAIPRRELRNLADFLPRPVVRADLLEGDPCDLRSTHFVDLAVGAEDVNPPLLAGQHGEADRLNRRVVRADQVEAGASDEQRAKTPADRRDRIAESRPHRSWVTCGHHPEGLFGGVGSPLGGVGHGATLAERVRPALPAPAHRRARPWQVLRLRAPASPPARARAVVSEEPADPPVGHVLAFECIDLVHAGRREDRPQLQHPARRRVEIVTPEQARDVLGVERVCVDPATSEPRCDFGRLASALNRSARHLPQLDGEGFALLL